MLAKTRQPGRRDLGREAFLDKVWEWKDQYGGTISTSSSARDLLRLVPQRLHHVRRPGAPAGEEGNFHDAVMRVFVDPLRQGPDLPRQALVNWDPHFETAISDLEVEQVEVAGHMWHLRYPLERGRDLRAPHRL
jgi:valyl-tRNA synthetase